MKIRKEQKARYKKMRVLWKELTRTYFKDWNQFREFALLLVQFSFEAEISKVHKCILKLMKICAKYQKSKKYDVRRVSLTISLLSSQVRNSLITRGFVVEYADMDDKDKVHIYLDSKNIHL